MYSFAFLARRAALALALAALVPACAFDDAAPSSSDDSLAETALPIIGGVTDPGDPSIVELSLFGGCTGTVVAPRVILTAAHCVSDPILAGQTATGSASFGTGGSEGFFDRIGIADMVMFRLYEPPAFLQYDIALIRLKADAPATARPIPINIDPLTQDDLGLAVRTVGFGVDDGPAQTGFGTKRQVHLTVDEVTHLHIGIGTPTQNICQGDSGGPTLATFDGEERVIGVASFGSDKCRSRASLTRTDIYADWLAQVLDAWDGPCQLDGVCVTDGCRFVDPDCDVCAFDGVCGTDCEQPDLDCPLGKRVGQECSSKYDCESRVCLQATDDPRISYCSQPCDPNDSAAGCDAPLSACVAGDDGNFVCAYGGITPGAQGSSCKSGDDCRSGVCDPDDDICIEQCGDGQPACGEGFECRDVGGTDACRLPSTGGCQTGGGGNAGWLTVVGLFLVLGRRRRGSLGTPKA